MRPLTDRIPKRWFASRAARASSCSRQGFGDAGVVESVVNVHYLPDQIIEHVAQRAGRSLIIFR